MIMIIVGAAIGGLVLAMVVVQSRHKALMEKRQKIQALTTSTKKLQNLLRSLPPQYLNKDVKAFLYQSIIQNLRATLALKPDNADYVQSDLEMYVKEQQSERGRARKPMAIDTVEQANIARASLKSLYEAVKESFEAKRILGTEAEKLIQQIEFNMLGAAIDLYNHKTTEAEKEKDFKNAIGNMQKLITALGKSKRKGHFKQEIIEAKARIKDLQEKWKQTNVKAADDAADDDSSMDQFLADQGSWQKSQNYD